MESGLPHGKEGGTHAICTARRHNGEPCKAWAMPNGKCRTHGGKSLAGIAHPQFQTGRYAKTLPKGLATRYEEALSDPELVSLRQELALVQSLIEDRIDRLASVGESGAAWRLVQAAFADYNKAYAGKDAAGMADALNRLAGAIERGAREEEAWADIRSLVQQRKGLAESERRRMLEAQQYVAVEQAMGMMQALLYTIKLEVKDPDVRARIQTRFLQLTQNNGS